jgi:translation elongation factor EF-1beta
MMRKDQGASSEPAEGFSLKVRLAMGHDRAEAIARELDNHVTERRVTGVSTAKQGIALDMEYYVRLRKDRNPDEVVRALNRIEGVQSVEISVRTSTENTF